MRIARLFMFCAVVVVSLGLSSCGSSRFDPTDDGKIGDTRFEQIIEVISNKDKEAMKNMFSKKALEEADDIDGGIEYLMSFYKGKIISTDVAREGDETNDYGVKTSELKCVYTVKTDEDTYTVFFIDKLVDTENPDNVGLYMLQIIKASDQDKYFDWGEGKSKCAGIYRPADESEETIVS